MGELMDRLLSAMNAHDLDAFVACFAVHDVLTAVAAEHGLSLTQLRLLGVLRDRTPNMATIAEHLGLDRSSVSGLIDRAELRGLVARTASTEDGRVTMVHITAAGLDLGRKLADAVTAHFDGLLAGVAPAEVERIVRVAESLVAAAPRVRGGR